MFVIISCSKRLNPFNPNNNGSSENIGGGEVTTPIDPPIIPPIENPNDENEPEWFLDPEEQIEPFMEQTLIFTSEVNNNNQNSPKHIYRIPGITVSEKNTIIAVADSRKNSYEDVGFANSKAIDIVVKRSEDGGKSWGPEIIIPPLATSANDAHGDSLFFSCANGDLVVLCAAGGAYAQEKQEFGGSKIMVSRSVDDGISWSDWKLAEGNVNSFGQGLLSGYDRGFAASGTGARLANGTLMGAMLVNKGTGNNTVAAAVIVSTDNGNTWTVRSIAKRKSGTQNEPKVVTQLNDGRILLSVRSGDWRTKEKKRVWFRSVAELGSQWEEITPTGNFYDGACNAEGILFTSTKYGYDKNRLIHLALDSNADRRNLTAFISYDEGMSWEKQRVLNSGRAGYAALARLNDGTIVTLSEEQGGQANLPQNATKELYNIVFRRFNLRWLTDGKDAYTPPDKTAIMRRW
ncbi:hypothetical protein BFL38_03095 [Brachyspira hampsonii]|uniref:exo-alpha-sialidase n=1 Tax=Brachyspira hampsonii TaxID=1287055 RepID=A0A1E5NCD1_9SPIR|nr:sialidase family protein [Brachyspira hampsonii]OEJ13747.1 hypothetical protein BFL38_03095 [Brachyspira hampsonii]